MLFIVFKFIVCFRFIYFFVVGIVFLKWKFDYVIYVYVVVEEKGKGIFVMGLLGDRDVLSW